MSTTAEQDILDTLTPEERAAIGDTEYSPEELAAMKGLANEGGGDDDDGDDSGAGGAPIEGKPAAVESLPAAPAPEPSDAAEPAASTSRQTAPVYRAELPSDYDAQVSALAEETRALAQKFKAGEIEFEDYDTQQNELLERRDSLRDARIKADIASEMGAQTAEQAWNSAVKTFLDTSARNGVDYRANQALNRDLDFFVKSLAGDEANNDKPMDWFLQEAHKFVTAKHGLGAPPAAAEQKPPASRKPPVDALPKTLAQVPGSDGPGDVGDEFSDLDSLEGLELEDALRKMSPAQREKYAMAGR